MKYNTIESIEVERTRKCLEMMTIPHETGKEHGLASQAPLCQELVPERFQRRNKRVPHQLVDKKLLPS